MENKRFVVLAVQVVIIGMLTSASMMTARSQEDRIKRLTRAYDEIERRLEKLDLRMSVIKEGADRRVDYLRTEINQYVIELRELKRTCVRMR